MAVHCPPKDFEPQGWRVLCLANNCNQSDSTYLTAHDGSISARFNGKNVRKVEEVCLGRCWSCTAVDGNEAVRACRGFSGAVCLFGEGATRMGQGLFTTQDWPRLFTRQLRLTTCTKYHFNAMATRQCRLENDVWQLIDAFSLCLCASQVFSVMQLASNALGSCKQRKIVARCCSALGLNSKNKLPPCSRH